MSEYKLDPVGRDWASLDASTSAKVGPKGQIVIDDAWVPGRNIGPSTTQIHITTDKTRSETLGDERMLLHSRPSMSVPPSPLV